MSLAALVAGLQVLMTSAVGIDNVSVIPFVWRVP